MLHCLSFILTQTPTKVNNKCIPSPRKTITKENKLMFQKQWSIGCKDAYFNHIEEFQRKMFLIISVGIKFAKGVPG